MGSRLTHTTKPLTPAVQGVTLNTMKQAQYLTISAAAAALGYSDSGIRKLVAQGKLTEAVGVVQGGQRMVTAASVRKLQQQREKTL